MGHYHLHKHENEGSRDLHLHNQASSSGHILLQGRTRIKIYKWWSRSVFSFRQTPAEYPIIDLPIRNCLQQIGSSMASQETYTQVWQQHPFPAYTHGLSFHLACAKHLSKTLHVSRPYIIASGTLSRTTDNVERLERALEDVGINVVGVRKGMRPHTLYSDVLETVDEVCRTGADCVVTVGGGSLIDGAKAVIFLCCFLYLRRFKTFDTSGNN